MDYTLLDEWYESECYEQMGDEYEENVCGYCSNCYTTVCDGEVCSFCNGNEE